MGAIVHREGGQAKEFLALQRIFLAFGVPARGDLWRDLVDGAFEEPAPCGGNMIICNFLGCIMVFVGLLSGFAVCGLASLLLRDDQTIWLLGFLAGIAATSTGDLWYRCKHHQEKGWFRYLSPLTGGQFFFIPVWALWLPAAGRMVLLVAGNLGWSQHRTFGHVRR
jgi:hypothetical protein